MELAEKANISITFLSNIERNNKWPYPETLVKLAKALDVEVQMLFQGEKSVKNGHIREILPQFKKDIEISLHKKVTSAIDSSLSSIYTLYMVESGEEPEIP